MPQLRLVGVGFAYRIRPIRKFFFLREPPETETETEGDQSATAGNRPTRKITRTARARENCARSKSMNPDESLRRGRKAIARLQKSQQIRGIVNSNINESVPAALSRPAIEPSPGAHRYHARRNDASLLFINVPIKRRSVARVRCPASVPSLRPPRRPVLHPSHKVCTLMRRCEMYTFRNLITLSGGICALAIDRDISLAVAAATCAS